VNIFTKYNVLAEYQLCGRRASVGNSRRQQAVCYAPSASDSAVDKRKFSPSGCISRLLAKPVYAHVERTVGLSVSCSNYLN